MIEFVKIKARHDESRKRSGFAVLTVEDLKQIDSLLDYLEHSGHGDLVLRIQDHEWQHTIVQVSVKRDKIILRNLKTQ